MSYTPPLWDSVHFDFTAVLPGLSFNFTISSYSPPPSHAVDLNFLLVLPGLAFHFAPTVPEPISKHLLKSLALRLSGQVYKYWVCFIWRDGQRVRRYWEHDLNPSPWLSPWQTKFAAGMLAWQNLPLSDSAEG